MPTHDLVAYRDALFERAGTVPGEEWRQVVTPRFVSPHYMISNAGRVISLPRWRAGANGPRIWKGKVLRPSPQKSGHLRVNILDNTERHMIHVHRLVMWAFVGPQAAGQAIRHLDGDLTNNRRDNLAYASRLEAPGRSDSTGAVLHMDRQLLARVRSALEGKLDPMPVLADIVDRLT